jgi:proteasome lid subunit RPN8/RPN11
MHLNISSSADHTMRNHALKDFPNECVGFLYGHDELVSDDQTIRKIESAVPISNSKEGDQRRRFEISPLDYMKAEHYALENNLTLLGVYHSHPLHPAIPSEHDLKQALPFFSYIIVSVQDKYVDHIRSWQLNEAGVFEEEKIEEIANSINNQ